MKYVTLQQNHNKLIYISSNELKWFRWVQKGSEEKGSEKVDKGPQRLKRVKINVSNQQWGIFRCIIIGQIIFLLDENLRGFHRLGK